MTAYRVEKKRLSFNRYMVECEFKNPRLASITGTGFNRYMVECESYRGSADFS